MEGFYKRIQIVDGLNKVVLSKVFSHISGFTVINFGKQGKHSFKAKNTEIGLLILRGSCDINIEGKEYKNMGSRKDVFSGKPAGAYIPLDSRFSVKGRDAEIALCAAKCGKKTKPAVFSPEDILVKTVGSGDCEREVRLVIPPETCSVNLILGETINPPGKWSSTPPARHEKNNLPGESLHEEIYYFKTDRPKGWGIERIYSPERNVDEFIYVEDNTAAFMPWGYHQVAAPTNTTLYYLFFLAGEGNKLAQYTDPDYSS